MIECTQGVEVFIFVSNWLALRVVRSLIDQCLELKIILGLEGLSSIFSFSSIKCSVFNIAGFVSSKYEVICVCEVRDAANLLTSKCSMNPLQIY